MKKHLCVIIYMILDVSLCIYMLCLNDHVTFNMKKLSSFKNELTTLFFKKNTKTSEKIKQQYNPYNLCL